MVEHMKPILVLCLGLVAATTPLWPSESPSSREEAPPRVYDELFGTELPGRYNEGEWSISLNPKFGDLIDDDYIRFLVGLRYNFSNYFDAFTDLGTYFPNPAGDGERTGLYTWRIGGRYTWYDIFESVYDLATGIETRVPLPNAPTELSDGYSRYTPFFTIGRYLRSEENWLVYLQGKYEFVDGSPFGAEKWGPQPRDRLILKPGFVHYDGGEFRYSLELEYRTNALHFRKERGNDFGDEGPYSNRVLASEEVHELIAYPGITWFPDEDMRSRFFLPGNWEIGLRVEVPVIEETGVDWGLSVRFRWYYDYRKAIRKEIRNLFSGVAD